MDLEMIEERSSLCERDEKQSLLYKGNYTNAHQQISIDSAAAMDLSTLVTPARDNVITSAASINHADESANQKTASIFSVEMNQPRFRTDAFLTSVTHPSTSTIEKSIELDAGQQEREVKSELVHQTNGLSEKKDKITALSGGFSSPIPRKWTIPLLAPQAMPNHVSTTASVKNEESNLRQRSSDEQALKTTDALLPSCHTPTPKKARVHAMKTGSGYDSAAEGGAYRKGKWTPIEEEYTLAIIKAFMDGIVDVEPGTTLRAHLSNLLQCDPMRITKKLSSQEVFNEAVELRIGKSTYNPRKYLDKEKTEKQLQSVELLRREFWKQMGSLDVDVSESVDSPIDRKTSHSHPGKQCTKIQSRTKQKTKVKSMSFKKMLSKKPENDYTGQDIQHAHLLLGIKTFQTSSTPTNNDKQNNSHQSSMAYTA